MNNNYSERLKARIAAEIPEFIDFEIDEEGRWTPSCSSPAYCVCGVFPGGEIRQLTDWDDDFAQAIVADAAGEEGVDLYIISQAGEIWEVR